VIELAIPPLRERRADILPLARRFLAAAAHRLGKATLHRSSRPGASPVNGDQPARWLR